MAEILNIIEEQKASLLNVKRIIQSYEAKAGKTRGYAQMVFKEIESITEKFKDAHEILQGIVRDNTININDISYFSEEIFYQFQDLSFTFRGQLFDFINESTNTQSPGFHSTFSAPSHTRNETIPVEARLPKIDIPTFAGDYLSWIAYRDMFISLVHNNQALTNVQKFYFLKSSCSDTPLGIVNEYPASDANYNLAWNALNRRYHNKRKIVDHIYGKLFTIPNSNGSAESIQNILDTTRNCLALLNALDISTEKWDSILIYLTVNKLDRQSRKEWEQSLKGSTEIPPIEDLFTFLETAFRTLESIDESDQIDNMASSRMQHFQNRTRNIPRRNVHMTTSNTTSNDSNCPCCNKRHLLVKCFKFIGMTPVAKNEFINSMRICRNCLNTGHFSYHCRSLSRCQTCQQNHHTILHNVFSTTFDTTDNSLSNPNILNPVPNDTNPSTSAQTTDDSFNVACNFGTVKTANIAQVLLATVQVSLKTHDGNFNIRALLDQCAQATLISRKAVDALKLPMHKTYVQISGLGNNTPYTSKKYVEFTLLSNLEPSFKINCKAYVLPKITSYQPLSLDESTLPNLNDYQLADPYFSKPGSIDILLGGDVYGNIILPKQQKFKNSIFIQSSHFGWIVSGPTKPMSYQNNVIINVCSLEQQLRAFWEQEELLEKRSLTEEENLCEQHFRNTTTRDSSGRYTVSLPFKSLLRKNHLPNFNHTDYTALSRLKSVEAKCSSKPDFGKLYQDFMEDYEKLGHMKRVGIYPRDLQPNGFFLPHHGILKENSSTTKLRVVFDGSCKRGNQPSLNEELASGPALQNDLPIIITRWRRYKIGFRADLEKMFRQIKVVDEQQKYQQILWRSPGSDKIIIYKLSTVTYGTKPAPFLSIRVLQQLSSDENDKYPLACKVLNTDTYVDDVISGADNLVDALELHTQLCQLLYKGKFNLRKWTTNSEELLSHIPLEFRENSNVYRLNAVNTVKALGLEWNTVDDCFSFKINFDNSGTNVTKRSLLSDAAKLYDPLGWLSPTTILAKIEFQNLWLLGLDWNDCLPETLKMKWLEYRNNLKELEKIKIRRWIGLNQNVKLEIHGFCDSSKLAYAAVVYAKTISDDGYTQINIIQAKTKVSPLKRITIPRMELCGANLLVKLVNKITSYIDTEISQVFYWTDSTTVLSWIRGQSSRWPVFVGNRVAEIQRMSTTAQWKYVSTRDNPADCASRGISSKELVEHDLWWSGPKWLKEIPSCWPKQPNLSYDDVENIAVVNTHITEVKTNEYPELLTEFSTLNKLIRVTAYRIRFKNNFIYKYYQNKLVDKGYSKMTGFLTTKELNVARFDLIRISQQIDFFSELLEFHKKGYISSNTSVARLCPFVDSSHILRVGGRIQNSELSFSSKHPILLKKQNPLSYLIFLDAHIKTLHGGLNQMQSYVLREYWILYGKNIAKLVLRKCTICFKYNAKAAQQMMGNLPSVRLKPSRPFKHSGVDYAGPITIKQSTARNSVTTKGYICLFVCMVTKALHLEAVTSLSTDAFMAAFRRFVSRRGVCTDLYSDCGTNFIGASKELQILYNRNKSSIPKEMLENLASNGTTWHFIPPASPNFGGLWEAGVKSTKYHLKRIMMNRVLTFEELTTLLAQIECCLNSRPLCPLSCEPRDCNALTPAHFLISEPTLCIPEEDLLDVNIDRLSRWKVVESLKQHFWRRWANEWLSRLQARPKWLKLNKNAEKGDLVIVFDERCSPGEWPLARVQDVHPGKDGCVRVVTLFSNGKTYKRPISKIAFLPTNECFESTESDLSSKPKEASMD
ncbi:uncharacterized protein LOC135950776 [Calliphora vicina]|uniref:uncharacterized protein LOC135950776 n=1 Tax=Calliphora vicina TaxID=7373 RepID=UPI00325B52E7